MSAKLTHLDEIINYKSLVVSTIRSSQKVMELISDIPNINLDSDSAQEWESHIYDYGFITSTFQEAGAYIMTDIIVPEFANTIKDLILYIQIVCDKNYVDLKTSKIKGIKGNRLDNLARYTDLLFNCNRELGIGQLDLKSLTVASVPDKYTSKLLIYKPVTFSKNRDLIK